MKNFKLFMKAIDEELSEGACMVVFCIIMCFIFWLCYIYPIILCVLAMTIIYLIMVETVQELSKWSKKVMKTYKQLKGENDAKL